MLKILLVGCGRMGEALANGWLNQGRDPAGIWVVEPNQKSAHKLISKGVRFYLAPDQLPPDDTPNVIIFAVKPQVMDEVVPFYARFASTTMFASIAAGRTIEYLETILGIDAAIVRVMPNTPAAVSRGISCAFANNNVSRTQREICNELIEAVGEFHWLESESQIDAVTAVSGSGPAYVFLLSECLAKAGIKLGLSKNLAERLGRVTISGSGELLHQSTEDVVTLRQNVTSSGGTTEAALSLLMSDDRLETLLYDAIQKAFKRSKELAH